MFGRHFPASLGLRAAILTATSLTLASQVGSAQDAAPPGMTAETFSALRFRNVGPGLMSGRIADIAIHPGDRATWYVGVGSGGVWKTENAGTTWTPLFDGQGSYSIGEVELDPNNPDVVWVGTGENVSGRHVGYGDGVYRSRDGGVSWDNLGLSGSEHIGRISIDPRDSEVVLVAAEGPLWSSGGDRGIFRTTDGGTTWTPVLTVDENTGATDIERDPSDPDVLYAATYQRRRKVWALLAGGPGSGIHKSTDGGLTWREVTGGLPSGDLGKINLAISPLDPAVVYATIEADGEDRGFYRSTDKGESWEKRNSYTSGGTGPHYYQEIYASPHVFDRIYQMDVWINFTEDGGSTFRELGEPDKHSDNHALAFVEGDPDYLLAGSDGGLYESFDHGASWRFVSNLPVTQIYKMALDDAEPFYNLVGGTQDNGTIYGPSRTASVHGIQNRDWIVPYGADGYDTSVDPENPDILYLTWQNGRLLRYDRRTREPLDIQPIAAPGDEPERWNWDAPLEISPHRSSRLYFASQRLWRSDDRGNSWTPISGDLSRGGSRYELPMGETVPGVSALYDNGAMSWYGNATSLSESPLVEGLSYVGTEDGVVSVTEDGGATWRSIPEISGIPERAFINALRASETDPNTVYVVFDNHKAGDYAPYLVRSEDRGRTWTSMTGDLPDRQILWSIAQDHVDEDLLFLGAEFGLFFTVDGGEHWIRFQGGVPVIPFRDIQIQRRESDLVGASFGRGFFVLDDYSLLREVDEDLLNRDTHLFEVRDAWRYVPSVDLGVRGKGYQGGGLYAAPNPAFGATFTYYLRESTPSARELRETREAALRAAGEDVPFPGLDSLRAEAREPQVQMFLLISDAQGEVVRRVPAPAGSGIHRVSWDLRFPSPDPIDLSPSPVPIWSNEPAGPLVAPGEYRVQLARLQGGLATPVGGARTFIVRPLPGAETVAMDAEGILDFQRMTGDLQRRASGLGLDLGEMRDRIRHMRAAALQTSDMDGILESLGILEARILDLQTTLTGDRIPGQLNEPSLPSVAGRISQVVDGHWWTTEAPTETFRASLEVARRELVEIEEAITPLSADLEAVEARLEAAGAPRYPGRRGGP
jgi:photosystem II stability/assembly factor-like uncharacterized protein